jgi:hypothetical protein
VQKFCSLSCSNANHNAGEGNPAWAGGNAMYWKRKCRERDDFTCQFPGCGFRHEGKRTHAHHRIPREAGGPDTLENLITLCEKHHREVEGLFLKHLVQRAPVVVQQELSAFHIAIGLPQAERQSTAPMIPTDVVFVKP